MSRVRVFIAMSLDGFIAGPNDELDWLPHDEGIEDTFTPFLKQVGALLMGRRTFDVASSFDVPWPYGDTPVMVATTRPLKAKRASISKATGSIDELIDLAKKTAAPCDVYLDGGKLIRAALDRELIDELIVTVVPMVLGTGIPLFAGTSQSHALKLNDARTIGGGLVQLTYAR